MLRLATPFVFLALVANASGDFTYNDFSNTAGLRLNGDTVVVNNQLQLTYASTFSTGSVFTTNQVALGDTSTFSTHFQFQMTNSGGISDEDGQGADGIVFVVQKVSNNVGTSGFGIGYAGISPSLGIEFDTYHNSFDPDGNHVGVDLNGNITSIATQHEPTRFNNGQIWNAWIDYDGSSSVVNVYWSMMDTRPAAPQLSASVNLQQILGDGTGFVGFTSATGSAWNNQDILNWQFSQTLGVGTAVPEPSSWLMLGIGLTAAVARRSRPK